MMTKFLNLLARAQVVLMDAGIPVKVQLTARTIQPGATLARLSWTEDGAGACSSQLTVEGLASMTFDAKRETFTVIDHEGNPVVLQLRLNDTILTPDYEDVVYVFVQEGGSSGELYIHTHTTRAGAEAGRVSCRDEGSYRTSEDIIEVPVSLASHPMFYEFAEMLVGATTRLGFPAGDKEAA